MSTFPLTRLPWLAFREVASQFAVLDFINIVQCSKKFTQLLKLADSERLQVSIDCSAERLYIGSHYLIMFHDNQSKDCFGVSGVRNFNGIEVPYVLDHPNDYGVSMYWNGIVSGLHSVAFHLLKFLNSEIGMFSSDYLDKIRIQSTLDYIKNRQKSIEVLHISKIGSQINELLSCLQVTMDLQINLELEEGYELKMAYEPLMIKISKSSWFTLNQLLALNCVRIELTGSLLTNNDITVYVNEWKAGGLPNLRNLVVTGENLNATEPISGVAPPIQHENLRTFHEVKFQNYKVRLYGGVEIQNKYSVAAVMRMQKILSDGDGVELFCFLIPDYQESTLPKGKRYQYYGTAYYGQ